MGVRASSGASKHRAGSRCRDAGHASEGGGWVGRGVDRLDDVAVVGGEARGELVRGLGGEADRAARGDCGLRRNASKEQCGSRWRTGGKA